MLNLFVVIEVTEQVHTELIETRKLKNRVAYNFKSNKSFTIYRYLYYIFIYFYLLIIVIKRINKTYNEFFSLQSKIFNIVFHSLMFAFLNAY